MKVCTKCKEPKSFDNFYRRDRTEGKFTSWCKKCVQLIIKTKRLNSLETRQKISIYNRRWRLKTYKLTEEQYLELFKEQNGVCAICKISVDVNLCVDHNHKTEKTRGLLCNKCNAGMGNFGDDINLLKEAIEYLKRYE